VVLMEVFFMAVPMFSPLAPVPYHAEVSI